MNALQRLLRMQHRPDLALTRQYGAMQVCGDDGDFRAFVRVGEGAHAGDLQEAGHQPVPARGAVFNDDVGNLAPDFAEKALRALNLAAQALAERIRVFAADADGLVVINFDIAKAIFLQQEKVYCISSEA